jgi:hypothetical protein
MEKLLIFGSITLVLVYLLISIIEMTVMQLFRWGDRKECLAASLKMNAVSSIIGVLLVILFQSPPPWWGLVVAWLMSVLIESRVLTIVRRETALLNTWAVVAANLASYVIVIIPTYMWH